MIVYIKLIAATMFWGGTFVAGRLIGRDMEPISVAFLRFVIASTLLVILTLKTYRRLPRPSGVQFLVIIVLAITGISAYNALFFTGLKTIQASHAALIIATCPAAIALGNAIFMGEKLTSVKVLGILLSITGAAIVISKGKLHEFFGSDVFGWGHLCIFGCVLCWAAYSIIGKPMMKHFSPLALVCYSSVLGTLILLVPAILRGLPSEIAKAGPRQWANIGYMAIFATFLAYVWYYEAVKKLGATKAGLFINFVPIWAVIFSFIILRDPITPSLLAGGALVTGGVYLTNRFNRPTSKNLPTLEK